MLRDIISKLLSPSIIVLLVLSLLIVVWYEGKYRGRVEQKVTQAQEQIKVITKGVQAHATEQRKTQKLSDPDLDADLAKWMRD